MFKLFISFYMSVRDTFLKEKWYLYITAKTSSPFSGVWQINLLVTLRYKLGTKF